MSLFRRKNVAMLEGPLIPKIFALAIPLMISNLLQMLYSAADMIVVAKSGVSGAVGAIGSTTQVIQLVLVLSVGFAVGANVLVARAIGAKDEKKVSDAVHTALLTALLFGSVGGTIGFVFSEQFMIWMGAEGDLLKMAVKYCRIRFIGLPFLAMTNFLIAIFRAKGDGTTPLMSLALSGLVNVLLNLVFVLVFGMDVDGVAWATAIASVLSVVQMLHHLRQEDGPCRFSFRLLKIDGAILKELLRIGLPASLQSALYTISNLLISSSLIALNNRMFPGGSAVLDGNSAAFNVSNLATTCCDALALSYVSFAGQHCGAKLYKRLKTFIADAYLCSFCFSLVLSLTISLLRKPLLSLYLTDPAAYEVASTRMDFMMNLYFLGATMSCGAQILRGMGWSMTAALITLITTCVLRVVWVYTVFAKVQTLPVLYMSYPLSWVLAAITQFVGVVICYRKIVNKSRLETAAAQ